MFDPTQQPKIPKSTEKDDYSISLLELAEIFKRNSKIFSSIPDVDIRLLPNGFLIYHGLQDKIEDAKGFVKAKLESELQKVNTK